jgi:two-component system response regulator
MSDGFSYRAAVILLIEDNPGDADLAREALEVSRFKNELYVVEDGEAAVDFLKQRNKFKNSPVPDLIFLDLNLPRKDGREVLMEIKSDEKLKRIPVVVLTTSKSDEDILASYNLYANCFISKPLDFDKFLEVVRSINDFWLSIVVLPPRDL